MGYAYIHIVGGADAERQTSEQPEMTNETMTTSVDNGNGSTEPMADAKPTEARKPRVLPTNKPAKLTAAQKYAQQIATLQAKKREALERERAAKPARRSRDSGNTWQIKVAAALNPNGKIAAISTAVKPKLTKNANGMLPSDATIGTIRTDFYHSMRVFKSLTEAQRKALLAAI